MRKLSRIVQITLGMVVLLATVGWGQPQGWHYNAGGRLLGVKSRGNNIWVVGAQGLILHSTDRGDTWNIRESGTSYDLRGVTFPDDQNGWIVGDNDYDSTVVLRTTDGGANWQFQTLLRKRWGYGIFFVNLTHGWICGAIDTVFKTTDGGNTWTKHRFGRDTNGHGIIFRDTSLGWLVAGPIFKTTDGGLTWIEKTGGGGWCFDMLDSLRGWAAGGGGIYKTTDGWETGTLQYDPPAFLYGISIGDSQTAWSAGSYQTIAATSNGGSTWLAETSQTHDNTYYDVYGHLQLTNVTVVGDGGAIIRSTNAGNTWRVIRNVDIGNTSLLNTAFYDTNQGWAVGTYGVITHTTNGGMVWNRQASGATNFIYGVTFPTPQRGWICSYGAEVYTTTNAGITWSAQNGNTTLPLFSIEFLPDDTLYGWAVGGYYVKGPQGQGIRDQGLGVRGQGETALQSAPIRYGISQGSTKWTTNDEIALLRSSQPFRYGTPRNDTPWDQDTIRPWGTEMNFWKWPWRPEETILQLPYRVITRTTNGGALWMAQNSMFQVPLYGVSFVTRAEGWACGDPEGGMGVILHTTDSGATWQSQNSNRNQFLNWIQFRDPLNGWCVGGGGTTLWTTDGGNTWNQGNSGTTAPLWSCAFYDNLNGFACGNNGLLIKTNDGGRNWTPDTSKVYANVMAVNALDSTHAWTVGSYGMVLGWRLAGTSGVETRGQGDKETRANNSIKAWPNPFVSYVRVPGHEKEKFALYDITGRKMGTYTGEKIGVDVASGIYFLMAEEKEGRPMRIVKVR